LRALNCFPVLQLYRILPQQSPGNFNHFSGIVAAKHKFNQFRRGTASQISIIFPAACTSEKYIDLRRLAARRKAVSAKGGRGREVYFKRLCLLK
jgi:hypothetical protein